MPNLLRAVLLTLAMGALPCRGQVPTLEEVTVIGCAVCDGPELFAGIQALALDERGRLYVADRSDPLIRVFAPEGSHERSFVRTGDGPGEARLIIALLPAEDGLITVDMRQGRLTRYGPDASVLALQRFDRFPVGAHQYGADGPLLLAYMDWRSGPGVARWTRPGDSLTVVLTPPVDVLVAATGQRTDLFSMAAAPDGGFVVGGGEQEYRIRRYDAVGRAVRDYHRPLPRGRRSPEEIEAARDRITRAALRLDRRGNPEQGAADPEVDELRRHFSAHALSFDGDGRLWVRSDRGGLHSTVFDVFAVGGDFLGEVGVDGLLGRYAIQGDRMAAVATDADGVERVRVWRLRPPR
jgi:hypothetical protein